MNEFKHQLSKATNIIDGEKKAYTGWREETHRADVDL